MLAMSIENRKPRFPRDRTSLRKEILIERTEIKREQLIDQKIQDLPQALERLYNEAFPADLDLHDPRVDQSLAAIEMSEGARELIKEFRSEMQDLGAVYAEIEPSFYEFKKEKEFLIVPKIDGLKIETLARLYATYYALVHAIIEFKNIE